MFNYPLLMDFFLKVCNPPWFGLVFYSLINQKYNHCCNGGNVGNSPEFSVSHRLAVYKGQAYAS